MANHCGRHNLIHIKRDRLKGLIAILFNLSLLGRAFLTRHIDKVMAQIFIGHHPVRVPPKQGKVGLNKHVISCEN